MFPVSGIFSPGRVRTRLRTEGGMHCEEEPPRGSFELIPPVYIGRNVRIGAAAVVGLCRAGRRLSGGQQRPYQGLGAAAFLLCWRPLVPCPGALLCHGASVHRGLAVEGAAVGADSTVGGSCHRAARCENLAGEAGGGRDDPVRSPAFGRGTPTLFDDKGPGETSVELTPELAPVRCGSGQPVPGERIAVGAAMTGRLPLFGWRLFPVFSPTGGQVWDFGACIEPQFDFL